MWKKSKSLAACIFAAAWWGIFYPELCFSEDTCAVVQTEKMDAADVWYASGDEIVIRSRLWEWCEENLFDASKKEAQSVSEDPGQSAPAGRES